MPRWIVVPFLGQWAVKDQAETRDDLYRVKKGGRVWRNTSRENAQHLCDQLNKGVKKNREELSMSQKIHFMNARRMAKRSEVASPVKFIHCGDCGQMHKEGFECQ